MKKAMALMCVVFLLLSPVCALSEKARGISGEAESLDHQAHLRLHLGQDLCFATGNYLKTRTVPGGSDVIGHLEQADVFTLLDVREGFAQIQVLSSHSTSPDSYKGMYGWVDADYIDCPCSPAQYAASSPEEPDAPEALLQGAVCTADSLRVRRAPVSGEVLGHLEKLDAFEVLALENGWAYIRVLRSDKSSADSWDGLSGWVSAEYLAPVASLSPLAYEDVLSTFYAAVTEGWDRERLYNADFEGDDFPQSLGEAGYLLRDLDQNGVEELILLRKNDSFMGPVIALYTQKNGNAVRLFSSFARNRYYLLEDGRIYNEGSNGAAYSLCSLYEVAGDTLAYVEGIYSSDYQQNGKTLGGWFYAKEDGHAHEVHFDWMISDEEAELFQTRCQAMIVEEFPQACFLRTWR